MKKRALQLIQFTIWCLINSFGFARSFFAKLRNVDVDRVGRAMFDHCTSPKALYVTLFERWWIVGLCAFAGGCIGLNIIKNSVESYETHGSILIYQKMPTFLDNNMMLPDPKAYDSLFSTHVQLIGSQLIIERAIEHFDLENKCPKIVEECENAEEETTFLDYVRKNIKVGRAGSGDSAGAFVVTVGFGHTSDTECITVVDAVLQTYRDHVNKSLLFDQKNAFELVKRTRIELEREVEKRNQEYRDFLKSAPGVWNRATENNPHQARVDQFEQEKTTLQIKRVSLESRLSIMTQEVDAVTGKPLTDLARLALIDEDHIPRLDMLARIKRDQINAESQATYPQLQEVESTKFDTLLGLYAQRAELLETVGPTHPKVTDIDATIAELQGRLEALKQESEAKRPEGAEDNENQLSPSELVDAYVRMLKRELSDVTRKLEFLDTKIEEEVKLAHALTDFTIKAKHLQKEYEQALEEYQSVMSKSTKQHLLKEFGNFIAEIVGHPHHVEITWPKKPVILGLCTILGIFAGSFVALALDLIAYTPLRSVFWFLPNWLLGGTQLNSSPAQSAPGSTDEANNPDHPETSIQPVQESPQVWEEANTPQLDSTSPVPSENRPNTTSTETQTAYSEPDGQEQVTVNEPSKPIIPPTSSGLRWVGPIGQYRPPQPPQTPSS